MGLPGGLPRDGGDPDVDDSDRLTEFFAELLALKVDVELRLGVAAIFPDEMVASQSQKL